MMAVPIFILALFWTCVHANYGCTEPRPETANLTLTSTPDKSGQWTLQVHLVHSRGIDLNIQSMQPWSLKVNNGLTECDRAEPNVAIATFTVPAPTPRVDYEAFPGVGYFKFHLKKHTWEEARQICISEGADLAVVKSEPEDAYLKQKMVQHNVNVAFIGFHDRFEEGQYLTVEGKSLGSTGFVRWADPRLPDNGAGNGHSNADCGALWYVNGGLHDVPCTSSMSFFCKRIV